MNKSYIKNNIVNNTFKLVVNKDNIDEVYNSLPNIIKVINNKYSVNLIINDIDKNNKKLIDIVEVINALNIKDKKEKYEYIYDTVCKKLDDRINKENYCQFKDDICIKYRLKNQNHKNGCCECMGRGKCPYLIDSVCTMKSCMACKLFTCHTLNKMGIKHNINDFILIKYFFNNKQKDILRFSYWTKKEIVIDRLLKNKYVRSKGYKVEV